jgi:hypothetical protein
MNIGPIIRNEHQFQQMVESLKPACLLPLVTNGAMHHITLREQALLEAATSTDFLI